MNIIIPWMPLLNTIAYQCNVLPPKALGFAYREMELSIAW